MAKPGMEDELGEQVEDLAALDQNVTAAAEAAATAAAHAVAAARAAEEISRAREEAEARVATADIRAPAKTDAVASSEVAQSPSEANDDVPANDTADSADDEIGDLLNFDAPHVSTSSVLTRLALIALGSAAALLVVSFLLLLIVPKGMGSDVIVLASWLGIAVLSVGGFALLVGAGVTKVIRSGDRTG